MLNELARMKYEKKIIYEKKKTRFANVKKMILTREDVPVTNEVNNVEIKIIFIEKNEEKMTFSMKPQENMNYSPKICGITIYKKFQHEQN